MLERLAQYRLIRFLLGWPLVYLASGLYFGGIVGYAVKRAAAARAYFDGLLAAGTDPGALLDAAGTRNGLDPIGPAIAEGLPATDPVAIVLAVGVVAFPAVFFILVRLTRRTSGWKPTYGYVIGALGPLAGVGYGLVTEPLLEVELLLFVGAPVLTLGLLLGYAKVRPKLQTIFGS